MQKIPKWRGNRHFGEITGQHSRPLPPLGISHVLAGVEAPGGEKWEHLKRKRGKAMASYP